MFDKNSGTKYIEVKKLKEILKYLGDEDRIYPNLVGNFKITDNNGNYIGYIDLMGPYEKFQSY